MSVNNFLDDNVLYRLLLSRAITGPSFNFIPYVEVNVSGRFAHPSPKSFMYKELNVRRVKMWRKGSKIMKKRLKVELNCFSKVIFHKRFLSKNNLTFEIFLRVSKVFFYIHFLFRRYN